MLDQPTGMQGKHDAPAHMPARAVLEIVRHEARRRRSKRNAGAERRRGESGLRRSNAVARKIHTAVIRSPHRQAPRPEPRRSTPARGTCEAASDSCAPNFVEASSRRRSVVNLRTTVHGNCTSVNFPAIQNPVASGRRAHNPWGPRRTTRDARATPRCGRPCTRFAGHAARQTGGTIPDRAGRTPLRPTPTDRPAGTCKSRASGRPASHV